MEYKWVLGALYIVSYLGYSLYSILENWIVFPD
jgi:hypothetical protein